MAISLGKNFLTLFNKINEELDATKTLLAKPTSNQEGLTWPKKAGKFILLK